MSNLNLKLFAQPETLRAIRPDLLLGWLGPAAEYFARRGVLLPSKPGMPIPYEELAGVFLAPTPDMPQSLVDSLHLVHGLANPEGMDALQEAALANGLRLDIGPETTPADVAVQAWLRAPDLTQDVYNLEVLVHPREFHYFSAAHPAEPFIPPGQPQLRALEERLDRYFRASHRGGGTRVFAYRNDTEWWFLVRHGQPCRREETMSNDQPGSICFRPRGHDVLVYDTVTGKLRAHTCSEREQRVLLRAFGSCLFGNPDHFALRLQYTLKPLVESGRGCLACADIPGLERVDLVETEIFNQAAMLAVRYRCRDLFSLVGKEFDWPSQVEHIRRAKFKIKFNGDKRARQLTIVPWNKVLYGREGDSTILKQWIWRRGFALS